MLRTMAEPLGEVCSVTSRLLQRGLGLQTSRHVNVFFQAKVGYFLNRPRIINYNLDSEYDVKILDPNFVKLFKLAQLSIDYLLYSTTALSWSNGKQRNILRFLQFYVFKALLFVL